MKALMLAMVLLFCGCEVRVDEKGDLCEYTFIGRFRGISFYSVKVMDGNFVTVGIREDGDLASVSQMRGKVRVNTIYIDGKAYGVKEAKALLERAE